MAAQPRSQQRCEVLSLGSDSGANCVFEFEDNCQVTVLNFHLEDFTASNFYI